MTFIIQGESSQPGGAILTPLTSTICPLPGSNIIRVRLLPSSVQVSFITSQLKLIKLHQKERLCLYNIYNQSATLYNSAI